MNNQTKEFLFNEWAEYIEKVYGVRYDRKEKFVICPDCEEPLYLCDVGECFLYNGICPICGAKFDDDSEYFDDDGYNDEFYEGEDDEEDE